MEEGIAARGSHHPMEETHRKCRKLNSLFDCGRRGGEDSGGFLQEGLKDAEGWAAGKEWWGKVGGVLWGDCFSILVPRVYILFQAWKVPAPSRMPGI